MAGFEYELSITMDATHVPPYNELRRGLNERRLTVGLAPLGYVHAGDNLQAVALWRDLQLAIEETATHYKRSHDDLGNLIAVASLGGPDEPPNYTPETLYAACGFPAGWPRVRSNAARLPANWQAWNDPAYTFGYATAINIWSGDCGDATAPTPCPWLFEACRQAIRRLRYTRHDVTFNTLGAGVVNAGFSGFGIRRATWPAAMAAATLGPQANWPGAPDAWTMGKHYGEWTNANPPVWVPGDFEAYAHKITSRLVASVPNRYQSVVTCFLKAAPPDVYAGGVFDNNGQGNLADGLYVAWDTQINPDGDNNPTTRDITFVPDCGLGAAAVPVWTAQPAAPTFPAEMSWSLRGFVVTAGYAIADWAARNNLMTWQYL